MYTELKMNLLILPDGVDCGHRWGHRLHGTFSLIELVILFILTWKGRKTEFDVPGIHAGLKLQFQFRKAGVSYW